MTVLAFPWETRLIFTMQLNDIPHERGGALTSDPPAKKQSNSKTFKTLNQAALDAFAP